MFFSAKSISKNYIPSLYCWWKVAHDGRGILVESCSSTDQSSRPEVFLGKGVLKICSKFKEEHPCRSAISIKLQTNFIEIALRHGCSPVNFNSFSSRWLLLTDIPALWNYELIKSISDAIRKCLLLARSYFSFC